MGLLRTACENATRMSNPLHGLSATWALPAFLVLAGAAAGSAEETEDVYGRYSAAVVKIEVTETSSGAKALIGSGFFIDESGILATNYHVIERLIHKPERYSATWHPEEGKPGGLTVLAIDIVHDLALVRAQSVGEPMVLSLAEGEQRRGSRLYSLGYPHDISQTIVEGTFNGLLENAFYEKIHFTGSINPGMSGGPTITAEGEVVGVNVSGLGEQVAFLVPSGQLAALAERQAQRTADATPAELVEEARQQILDHQEFYLSDLFALTDHQFDLGPFSVPTEPKPFFNCWADANELDSNTLYRRSHHECSTSDYLFISDSHSSGIVRFRHRWLESTDLGSIRFYSAYASDFGNHYAWSWASEENVTGYRCTRDFIEHSDLKWDAVLCLRAYKNLVGLYDAVFKVASLQEGSVGLESSLVLGGVSFETARQVSQRYLERISWRPSS